MRYCPVVNYSLKCKLTDKNNSCSVSNGTKIFFEGFCSNMFTDSAAKVGDLVNNQGRSQDVRNTTVTPPIPKRKSLNK